MGGAVASITTVNISGGINTFTGNSAYQGGAIYGSNTITLSGGTNNFIDNTATDQGGAIHARGNVTIVARDGDTTFQGNTANGIANAVYASNAFSTAILTLGATASGKLLFYDPVASNSTRPGLTIKINDDATQSGEVVFDGSHWRSSGLADRTSTVYGNTTVSYGTLALKNNVIYDSSGGSFTLGADATLSADIDSNRVAADSIILDDQATLAFDMTGATTSTGNLTLQAVTSIVGQAGTGDVKLTNFDTSGAIPGTTAYSLVTTSLNGGTANTGALYVEGVRHYTGRSALEYGLAVNPSAWNLLVKFIDATGNTSLTWTGDENGNWNTTDGNWYGVIDGTAVHVFATNDAVTFGPDASNKNVVVAPAGVTAGAMAVNDTYNFTGGTITATNVTIGAAGALGLVAGTSSALAATSVDFGASGKLNITGFVPDDSSFAGSAATARTVITTTGGVSNFNAANVTVADQHNVDFLKAIAAVDGTDVKVASHLRWYSEDATWKANGVFDIAGSTTFTLGAALTDNSSSTNKDGAWDGNSLIKTGDGTLILTAANTYGGKTTLSAGTLSLSGAGAIADSSELAMSAGSTFDISGVATSATIKDLSGDGTVALGTKNLTLGSTNDTTFSGTIADSTGGSLTKQGTGILTLTGANSYTGGTTISAGTLQIGDGGTTGSITGNVANNGTLAFNRSDTITFDDNVSGSGSLTQQGTGTLTLTGNNSYGATNVTAGTLSIAGDGNIGTGVNTLAGGALRLTGSSYDKSWTLGSGANNIETAVSGTTMNGVLSGSGGISLSSGSLTLTNNNTYTGATIVSSGTLALQGVGSIANSSGLTVSSGTTFDISGITPNNATVGALTAENGSTINLGALSHVSEKLAVTGSASFNNTTITVNVASLADGTYTLVDYGTLISATGVTVTATGLAPGHRGGHYFDSVGDALMYEIINGSANLTWNGTASASQWNTVDTNQNWRTGVSDTYFKTDDSVTFDDTASSKTVVVDAGGVRVVDMAVKDDYTFSGGVITASGAVTIDAGKSLGLDISANAPALVAGSVDFNSTGRLNITGYTPDETENTFDGSANPKTVITTTGGIANFNPSITVDGQTNADFLSASAYQEGNALKVETRLTWYSTDPNRKAHGDFTIADGNTFTLGANLGDNSASTNLRAGWDGKSLVKKGGGTLVLTGNNTDMGDTTVSEGTLSIASDNNIGNGTNTLNGAGLRLTGASYDKGWVLNAGDNTIEAAGAGVTMNGVLSGSGGFTLTGGSLTLTGTNNYQGPTVISASAVLAGRIGSGALVNNATAAIGYALTADQSVASLSGTGNTDLGSHTLTVTSGTGGDYSGDLSGAGGFTLFGGTQTLSGNSLHTGATTVTGGTLKLDGNAGYLAGYLVVYDGAALEAGTLRTASATVMGATARAAIGVYDVTNADAALFLADTTAANVVIDTIYLAGERTLTVSGTGGYSFDTLHVQGENAVYAGNALNAAGKTLKFDLLGTDAGSVMLTTDTAADITGATVALTNTPTTLQLGESLTLISKTSGNAHDTGISVVDGQVTYGYAIGGNDTLSLFLGSIRTDGDYALSGPYTARAGDAAGQSVTLDVGGTLTVTDNGELAMASSAVASATLNAAKLNAGVLTLDNSAGGGVDASIGALDVIGKNVTINLDGTAARSGTIGVGLGDLTFAGGGTLTVTTTNGGTMTAGGALAISGKDNVYDNAIALFAYDAAGVSVDATGLAAGDTALGGDGVVRLNDALTLNNFNYAAFGLGEGATLMQSVTGSFAARTQLDQTAAVDKTLTTFMTPTGSLVAYISKTVHNTAVTAASDLVVSPGAFGPVTDIYLAGLDMGGNALSVASNAGGAATFQVTGGLENVSAINLTRDGNDLSVAIDALGVTAIDTTVTLDGTTAADVALGDLAFANGRSLTVTSANGGTMTAGGGLSVSGAGNVYDSPVGYDGSNATHSFDLTGVNAGDTMLVASAAGAVDVDNATIVLNDVPTDFTLGQQAILISHTTGAAATTGASSSAGGVNYGYAVGGNDTLSLFLSSIQTGGDYAVTGPYTASAGDAAGQSVTLDVGGILTVDGGLVLNASATNAATLNAATLTTDSLTLTGANASAAIGVYDVVSVNSVLTLNDTAASNVVIDTVNLAGGRTLAVSGNGAFGFSTMNILGIGATYDGDLAAAGATLNFDLYAPVSPGQTLLKVTGSADLTGADLVLSEQNPLTLLDVYEGFNLITADGGLTAGDLDGTTKTDLFGNLYNIAVSGSGLSATLIDQRSFVEIIDDQLGAAGRDNPNIQSGGEYLDDLAASGSISKDQAYEIGKGFNDAVKEGDVPVQQFFGGYAAYVNTPLQLTMDRFLEECHDKNRDFFNRKLFEDARPVAGAASESGYASLYGPRDSIACGTSRIWAGGFGTWADQDDRSHLPGYDYDSQGAAVGYEYTLGNFNFGVAAAYSSGDLEVNHLSYKNDADIFNVALYGAYIHESGFYAEGGLGYGHAWNDYTVHYQAAPGGTKKGKYGSDAFTADLELGYIARLPRDFNLIPSVGVRYTYLRNDSWTERVTGGLIANRFESDHDDGVDIPLGLRFNRMFRFGCDGGFVVPEVRASYVYAANKSRPSITAGYAGAPGGAKMKGVNPGRSHWRVGGGLSGRINSRVDFRVDYDFETRSGFKGHNVNASVGLAF